MDSNTFNLLVHNDRRCYNYCDPSMFWNDFVIFTELTRTSSRYYNLRLCLVERSQSQQLLDLLVGGYPLFRESESGYIYADTPHIMFGLSVNQFQEGLIEYSLHDGLASNAYKAQKAYLLLKFFDDLNLFVPRNYNVHVGCTTGAIKTLFNGHFARNLLQVDLHQVLIKRTSSKYKPQKDIFYPILDDYFG